jgi:hypothetical protein
MAVYAKANNSNPAEQTRSVVLVTPTAPPFYAEADHSDPAPTGLAVYGGRLDTRYKVAGSGTDMWEK